MIPLLFLLPFFQPQQPIGSAVPIQANSTQPAPGVTIGTGGGGTRYALCGGVSHPPDVWGQSQQCARMVRKNLKIARRSKHYRGRRTR